MANTALYEQLHTWKKLSITETQCSYFEISLVFAVIAALSRLIQEFDGCSAESQRRQKVMLKEMTKIPVLVFES